MAVSTKNTVEWVTCSDCGDEVVKDNVDHWIVCRVANGLGHTSPVVDAELIGSCEIEPLDPLEGMEVEYNCFVCGSTVKQDASEDMTIDSRGNPVCSKLCKGVSKQYKELSERPIETVIEEAFRAYAELDQKEAEHKAYYKARGDALDRIVGLVGSRGHFQDSKGVVYELLPAKGTYVHFIPYEIRRTRRGNEKAGSLSLIRAEELGYTVERKRKPKKAPSPLIHKPEVIPDDSIPF